MAFSTLPPSRSVYLQNRPFLIAAALGAMALFQVKNERHQ
jgi:hypothetical protein